MIERPHSIVRESRETCTSVYAGGYSALMPKGRTTTRLLPPRPAWGSVRSKRLRLHTGGTDSDDGRGARTLG